MKKKNLLLLWLLISITTTVSSDVTVEGSEFAFSKLQHGDQNYNRYLNNKGIQHVKIIKRTSKNRNQTWPEVVDNRNRVLKKFGTNYQLSVLAEGRYRHEALLLFQAQRKKCKKNCSDYYLIKSNRETKQVPPPLVQNSYKSILKNNGQLLSLTSQGLVSVDHNGQKPQLLPAPFEIVDGAFGTRIDGDWMAIATADNGKIMITDKSGWQMLNLDLSRHGDRKGIVSIHPQDNSTALIAVYRYFSEYNKGLYILQYDRNQNKITNQGWLFNSEDRNVGFDPSIFAVEENNEITVSALNSSAGQSVYFTIPQSQMAELNPSPPQHILNSGFEKEKLGAFMIGGGISQVYWEASSSVEKDGVTFSEIDYLIADSIFVNANFEARLGDTSLTINYLQNKAQNLAADEIDGPDNNVIINTAAKEASSYLFSTIDFHSLLGASSSLRLQIERSETNGVAEIRQPGQDNIYQEFSTDYDRYALLVVKERGLYLGGDYVDYSMPSAVGFSDNNNQIAFAGYDPTFGISSLRFVIGYDALAYAKRYETDYSRFYFAGNFNIGVGWADISTSLRNEALSETGKNKIEDLPIFITVGGEAELGYIWQKRSKQLKGLGYSVAVGYRVNANYLNAGQSDESTNDVDTLAIEFSRHDIFHGPFFKANLIF